MDSENNKNGQGILMSAPPNDTEVLINLLLKLSKQQTDGNIAQLLATYTDSVLSPTKYKEPQQNQNSSATITTTATNNSNSKNNKTRVSQKINIGPEKNKLHKNLSAFIKEWGYQCFLKHDIKAKRANVIHT